MTNGERIRNMTDDELAAFFNKETLGIKDVCRFPCEIHDITGRCFADKCFDAFLKWLKQEAQEDE